MIVAPSFLTADFFRLREEIESIQRAKWLHFDVMDGNFVENITYDESVLHDIKGFSKQFFDCHLMIEEPLNHLEKYIDAGADLITFHYEAAADSIAETIQKIESKQCQVGISVKPATDIRVLEPFLSQLDLILVMSVEPGRGGQQFMMESLDKIQYLASMRKAGNHRFLIEVDGGINLTTAKLVKDAGADVIVVGSYLFNQTNRAQMIEVLENV